MGKKKRKILTQQPAFYPRQPRPNLLPVPQGPPRASVVNQTVFPGSKAFQAPHHQQETMIDLTDDTSPNVSQSSGSWKPVSGEGGVQVAPVKSEPQTGEKKVISSTTERSQKFKLEQMQSKLEKKAAFKRSKKSSVVWINKKEYEKNINKKPVSHSLEREAEINKLIKSSIVWVNVPKDNNKNIEEKKENTEKEIRWELNEVDTKDDQQPSSDNDVICISDMTQIQGQLIQNFDPQPKPVTKKPVIPYNDVICISDMTQIQGQLIQNFDPQPKPVTKKPVMTKVEHPTGKSGGNTGTPTSIGEVQNVNPYQANPSKPSHVPVPLQPLLTERLPSGVPRSFLVNQNNIRAIQPQTSSGRPASLRTSGVPRSFLKNQNNTGAIQPQPSSSVPRSFLNNQNNIAIQPQPSSSQPTTDQYTPKWEQNPVSIQGMYCFEPEAPNEPVHIQTDHRADTPQQYSPSDVYDETVVLEQDPEEDLKSQDNIQASQKRQSAFKRLGPVSQPKKPKLTINLLFSKDQSVREVVDKTEQEDIPVHLRKDIQQSKDEIVVKFLPCWPWKKNVVIRKQVTARTSKSVMILEQEQMEEAYEKDHAFFQVSVHGYPPHWTKEDVLDAVLEGVKGKSFIPCFIEFNSEKCKFLVIRSRSSLTAIHKLGFYIRKKDYELSVTISQTDLSLNQIDFIPRLILRKRLAQGYDGERKLCLKEFTLKQDVSHFIYFPLSRLTNQTELMQIQSTIAWEYITDLDLSHNKLTSLDGFELHKSTPKLKNLDLSCNCLERVTTFLRCRQLALRSLKLEGNPLCHEYTDPRQYVKVLRMIFPTLVEIDDLPIHRKGDLPSFERNYCPTEEAQIVVSKFLEVFFPLLDMPVEDRMMIEDLYDENASMTVTYRFKLRYSPLHRYFRNLFLRARVFEESEFESIEGAAAIGKLISKWPALQHDPYSFTVDVMHHSDLSTILRISGILKLTSESLAEDEHLLAFTRTVVLMTNNGVEYKIKNEMVYWDEATEECANVAFQINSVGLKKLSLKLESSPDKELKEKLIAIFMKLTDLDEKTSERCLEKKEWNLKSALEHFTKLLKLDDLGSLRKPEVTREV